MARSLMMHSSPRLTGPCSDVRRARSWTIALGPSVTGCVPVKEAEDERRLVEVVCSCGPEGLEVEERFAMAGLLVMVHMYFACSRFLGLSIHNERYSELC